MLWLAVLSVGKRRWSCSYWFYARDVGEREGIGGMYIDIAEDGSVGGDATLRMVSVIFVYDFVSSCTAKVGCWVSRVAYVEHDH